MNFIQLKGLKIKDVDMGSHYDEIIFITDCGLRLAVKWAIDDYHEEDVRIDKILGEVSDIAGKEIISAKQYTDEYLGIDDKYWVNFEIRVSDATYLIRLYCRQECSSAPLVWVGEPGAGNEDRYY